MKVAVTTLVSCVAALLALGMVMLYSSSMTQVGEHYLLMQLIWCALGLGSGLVAATMDYRWLKPITWPAWGLGVVLLVLVFVPHIGIHSHGANRWIGNRRFSFQPSEFAKLALILALAWYAERYQRQMPTWKRGIVIPSMFIGVMLVLVFREPDRGATILMASVMGTMLLIAGVRWRYVLPPVVAGMGGLALSLLHDQMRTDRITAWLSPGDHKSGAGYQAYMAILAFGAGGWTGLGLGDARQKLGFLPEHHTDFIFSIIGEELGLVASLMVVLAFVAIVICGLFIAARAPDPFGLFLGSGVTFLIGLQAAINIGVVTSALPNKGLSLPFISYGGSNLLLMITCVGLLLSIARRARPPDGLGDQPAGQDLTLPEEPSVRNPFSEMAPAKAGVSHSRTQAQAMPRSRLRRSKARNSHGVLPTRTFLKTRTGLGC
jgi:cell division protein FtsW